MHRARDDRILDLRRQLAAEIIRSLGDGADYVVAPAFGIPQPRYSELRRGLVDRCTMEWLIKRIHRMGGAVEIRIELGDAGRAWAERKCREMRERWA